MKKEFKVGIFGIAAIVLFVLGFNFLKGKSLFKGNNTYYAEYPNIDGLLSKNPVTLNGMNVGLVEKLQFKDDNSGNIIVSFSLSEDIKIPDNSIAKITSADIMGNKVISLSLGDSKTYATDQSHLKGETQAAITATVQKEIAPIKAKFEQIMGSVDSVLIIVRSIFNTNNLNNLDKSFNTIPLTLNNFNTTSNDVSQLVKNETQRIDKILANVEDLTKNLKNNNEKINAILSNAETTTEKLSKLEMEKTLQEANSSIDALKKTIDKVNNGNGSMALLLNDPQLYQNLEKSSQSLNNLLSDLKANPKRYVHFSVFSRKDKTETNK